MQEKNPSDFLKMCTAPRKGEFMPGELDDSALKNSLSLYLFLKEIMEGIIS